MPPAPAIAMRVPDAAGAYCREARRLRARYGSRPAELHARLRRIATPGGPIRVEGEPGAGSKCNPDGAAVTGCSGARPAPPAVLPHCARHAAERFAQLVADGAGGAVLRYAQRASLLRAARRMGIDRFDANLIIAAVEHRVAGAGRRPTRRPPTDLKKDSSIRTTALGVLACVVAEAIVASTVWWALAH